MEKISLCTVSIKILEPYLELMIKSALERLHLHEIIICNSDLNFIIPETGKKIGDVTIRRINLPDVYDIDRETPSMGHALGLHECIDKAQGDYIFFCDPDVIFYNAVDKIYLEFMTKYNLNYIGCAHESADTSPYKFFPTIINSLVRKDQLPDADFLKDYLHYNPSPRLFIIDYKYYKKAPSKYLIIGGIPEMVHKFKIPPEKVRECCFDTGCNLYLWALEKNWRWLSFVTYDSQNYKTSYYRSNFKLNDRIKVQSLFHHQNGRLRTTTDCFQKFQQVYEKSKEEED